jgi:hypothetical protein
MTRRRARRPSARRASLQSSPSFQGRTPAAIRTMAVRDGDAGQDEVAADGAQRGGAPGQQRADAGEEEQEQADGDVDAVVERRADGDLGALTYSLRTGKSVPQRTVKQAASRIRLLKRKLDSRETSDSSLFSVLRWSRWRKKVKRQTASTMTMKVVEPVADGGLREGVDGADEAGAGEQRAEDA